MVIIAPPQQLDLFIANATDVRAKHLVDLMNRNLFSLSKRRRTKEIHHQSDDSFVRVNTSEDYGIATVFDQDILIFLISQLIHARNYGRPINRNIKFSGYEFFRFVGKKKASGAGYAELYAALERLHHTHIETDIRLGKRRRNHQFTWLSEIKQLVDEGAKNDRHWRYEAVLPEFLFDAVRKDKPLVVTLDHRYFSLSSSLERWLYLFARKSAGKQREGWTETIQSLHSKSASTATKSDFAKAIRRILKKGEMKLFEYDIHNALLGQHPALHFERTKLLPEQRRPILTLLD